MVMLMVVMVVIMVVMVVIMVVMIIMIIFNGEVMKLRDLLPLPASTR